jgi:hypothetical protein
MPRKQFGRLLKDPSALSETETNHPMEALHDLLRLHAAYFDYPSEENSQGFVSLIPWHFARCNRKGVKLV